MATELNCKEKNELKTTINIRSGGSSAFLYKY